MATMYTPCLLLFMLVGVSGHFFGPPFLRRGPFPFPRPFFGGFRMGLRPFPFGPGFPRRIGPWFGPGPRFGFPGGRRSALSHSLAARLGQRGFPGGPAARGAPQYAGNLSPAGSLAVSEAVGHNANALSNINGPAPGSNAAQATAVGHIANSISTANPNGITIVNPFGSASDNSYMATAPTPDFGAPSDPGYFNNELYDANPQTGMNTAQPTTINEAAAPQPIVSVTVKEVGSTQQGYTVNNGVGPTAVNSGYDAQGASGNGAIGTYINDQNAIGVNSIDASLPGQAGYVDTPYQTLGGGPGQYEATSPNSAYMEGTLTTDVAGSQGPQTYMQAPLPTDVAGQQAYMEGPLPTTAGEPMIGGPSSGYIEPTQGPSTYLETSGPTGVRGTADIGITTNTIDRYNQGAPQEPSTYQEQSGSTANIIDQGMANAGPYAGSVNYETTAPQGNTQYVQENLAAQPSAGDPTYAISQQNTMTSDPSGYSGSTQVGYQQDLSAPASPGGQSQSGYQFMQQDPVATANNAGSMLSGPVDYNGQPQDNYQGTTTSTGGQAYDIQTTGNTGAPQSGIMSLKEVMGGPQQAAYGSAPPADMGNQLGQPGMESQGASFYDPGVQQADIIGQNGGQYYDFAAPGNMEQFGGPQSYEMSSQTGQSLFDMNHGGQMYDMGGPAGHYGQDMLPSIHNENHQMPGYSGMADVGMNVGGPGHGFEQMSAIPGTTISQQQGPAGSSVLTVSQGLLMKNDYPQGAGASAKVPDFMQPKTIKVTM